MYLFICSCQCHSIWFQGEIKVCTLKSADVRCWLNEYFNVPPASDRNNVCNSHIPSERSLRKFFSGRICKHYARLYLHLFHLASHNADGSVKNFAFLTALNSISEFSPQFSWFPKYHHVQYSVKLSITELWRAKYSASAQHIYSISEIQVLKKYSKKSKCKGNYELHWRGT